MDEMTVKAPRDGVVESLDLHPGDIVKPGPVATIADPEDLKLYVYVSALMLGQLRLDQKVELTADAYGDQKFEATVVQIATQGNSRPQSPDKRGTRSTGVRRQAEARFVRRTPSAGMTVIAHFPKTAPISPTSATPEKS